MDEATVSAGVVENHMVDGEAMLIKACKMKNARIAELEAALRKINALIDSPARFNAEVQAVLDSVIDTSDTKFKD